MATKNKMANKPKKPEGDTKKVPAEKGKPTKEESKSPAVGGSRARAVKDLLAKVEEKMTAEPIKATLGDYIRLVQLHQELDEDEPKEIKVTWVEPETKE